MLQTFLILALCAIVFLVLEQPKVAKSNFWRATVTPLASIIGSGFLVVGPILDHAFGAYAPLGMLALCALAYLFGMAVRQNIRTQPDFSNKNSLIEVSSSWTLALAYVISVTYYLNLFGAFAVKMTAANTQENARLVTTIMLLLVLFVGWTRGFRALERMEQISVSVKLAIIAGLILGLAFQFSSQASAGELILNPATTGPIGAMTLIFGLLVTVQGFEISRFLGAEYSAKTRIRSMQFAQFLSAGIYLSYILLMSYIFRPEDIPLEESAIIDMMAMVAPILPVLLIAAALAAQFSAAIADTGGCGGLVEEHSDKKLSARQTYLIVTLAGIALTWMSDIFTIISYASRAFAFYYALQAAEAARRSWVQNRNIPKAAFFAALALLGLAITIFGQPVE